MADTRLVQTAVIGSPDSDRPVIVPTDYRDLDGFRAHHAGERFWCGLLLSGCGRELTTKRYGDRACHFAHLADAAAGPSDCSRSAHSADHLYVRHAVGAWLRDVGHRVDGEFRGERLDEAVEFSLPGGVSRLRFQLAPLTAEQWTRHDKNARSQDERIMWLLAHPDDEAEAAAYDADNAALLMRCQTDGPASASSRRVEIGTRSVRGETDWDRLDQCTLDEAGRVRTPALRTTGRQAPPRPPRAATRATQPSAPRWTPSVPTPRPVARTRVSGDVEQEDVAAALRAEAADVAGRLRFECRAIPPNRPYVGVLLQEATALNQRLASASTIHQPLIVAIERATDLLGGAKQPTTTTVTPEFRARPRLRRPGLPFREDIPGLGQLARDSLIATARERLRVTWPRLCRRMDRTDLVQADPETIYQILRAADHSSRPGTAPLLSVLVIQSDPPRSSDAFVRIAREHGHHVPNSAPQRIRMRMQQITAVYAYWHEPPSAGPAQPEGPAAQAEER